MLHNNTFIIWQLLLEYVPLYGCNVMFYCCLLYCLLLFMRKAVSSSSAPVELVICYLPQEFFSSSFSVYTRFSCMGFVWIFIRGSALRQQIQLLCGHKDKWINCKCLSRQTANPLLWSSSFKKKTIFSYSLTHNGS